jgi:hypothetical protein
MFIIAKYLNRGIQVVILQNPESIQILLKKSSFLFYHFTVNGIKALIYFSKKINTHKQGTQSKAPKINSVYLCELHVTSASSAHRSMVKIWIVRLAT